MGGLLMKGKSAKYDAGQVIAAALRRHAETTTPEQLATLILASLDREGIRLAFKPRPRYPASLYK